MKRFYYVFLLLVVSMFLFTSCALQEIEIKADPTLQVPIATESILMSDLVDTEDIVISLSESFGEDAAVTHKSDNPLTYGVDLKIFDGQEILTELELPDFDSVPANEYPLITSDSSITLASFSSCDLGILEDIELTSLPATLVVRNATGVTVEATLTSGDTSKKITSGDKTDLADLFNVENDLMLESMSITFDEEFSAYASTTIALLVDFPFEFTITDDLELFTNKDDVGDEDIFGRSGEDSDDLSDILDGIESFKLHMDYDNTTGLPLKMEVQGWDVEKSQPTDSDPVTGEITVGEGKTVEFDLTDLIEDIKGTVPFDLVFTAKLPKSEAETYSLNMVGSLVLRLWLDLDTDLTIPITLSAQ
ncbi:hypothetical protein [Petrotoga olearia]|uniref:Uncharacterized protein n=2 Tax=Petrotoga olearia TaxID=156203 RepID=A0A2K1P5W5_9BACT|nr:hypothetical protein [Petrotoga olearia]PNR98107.1 hypothetical protein X929_00845 [Petrotoga olearia DSM 13574]RMA75526.1 hypothetical protein C8D75_0531 [Petrotoga olearia]